MGVLVGPSEIDRSINALPELEVSRIEICGVGEVALELV
jgi:hypothetical protein